MTSVWGAGLLIVAVLAAHLAQALREGAAEHRRQATLEKAIEVKQRSMWEAPITIVSALPGDLFAIALEDALRMRVEREIEAPGHPFIVPVPGEVDEWILELRGPVTEEERSRWIPFEFDGITFYLVPL